MKRTIAFCIFVLLTVSVYGQGYAEKVESYFAKRSCLPSVSTAYVHGDHDWQYWSGFQDVLPVITTLDSEGVERMADWAGRVIAYRLEEYAFARTSYLINGPIPMVHSSVSFNSLLSTQHPGAAKKAVIVSRSLMSNIRARSNYSSPENFSWDHHYAGRPQYLGFLWSNIGAFTSIGLGGDYNAVALNLGAIEFELHVKSAYFQANTFFIVDYECWVRPATGAVIDFYEVE